VPSTRRFLPKPGEWMVTFRQFMAFPMYAAAAWLLWLLSVEAGANGLALGFMIMLTSAFIVWLVPKLGGPYCKAAVSVLGIGLLFMLLQGIIALNAPTELTKTADRFSREKLSELREQNQPVFVNATADWCITCKVNERIALSTETVKEHFTQSNIVTLTADWTNRSDEIASYLEQYGRSGVPLYVFYPAGEKGVILPQLLTPSTVIEYTNIIQ
jgi:thiol:disulfide interchange protein DsbD